MGVDDDDVYYYDVYYWRSFFLQKRKEDTSVTLTDPIDGQGKQAHVVPVLSNTCGHRHLGRVRVRFPVFTSCLSVVSRARHLLRSKTHQSQSRGLRCIHPPPADDSVAYAFADAMCTM